MLVRHSLAYVVTNLVGGAFGLVTTMVLTRLLSPASYGLYGLGVAIVAFAGNLFFEWHGTSFIRFSRGHGSRSDVLCTFLFLFGALTVATAVACWAAYRSGFAPPYDSLAVVALIGAWAASLFKFSTRVQVADLRPARVFWMNATRAAVTFGLSAAAAYFTGSAIYVLASAAVGQLFGAGLFPPRGSSLGWAGVKLPLARSIVRFGFPVAISMTVAGSSLLFNRLMLDQLASTDAVGRFTAASFVVQNTLGLVGAGIGTASYALALEAIGTGDPAKTQRQLMYNFTLLFGTLVPAAGGLSLIIPGLAPLIVGPEFVEGVVELTPWLAAAAAIEGVRAYYFDHAFQFGKRTSYLILVLSAVVLLEAGLNLFLIPAFGEKGAAVALVCALVPSMGLALALSPRAFYMPVPWKAVFQITFAVVAMAAALRSIGPFEGLLGLMLQIAAGAAVYAAMVVALNVAGVREYVLKTIGEAAWMILERRCGIWTSERGDGPSRNGWRRSSDRRPANASGGGAWDRGRS